MKEIYRNCCSVCISRFEHLDESQKNRKSMSMPSRIRHHAMKKQMLFVWTKMGNVLVHFPTRTNRER